MKILANILFEILHRFVYDKHYQSTNSDFGLPTRHRAANRHNKYQKHNETIAKIYKSIEPYFEGWRTSLKLNLWFVKSYQRYEPKKLNLMDYEFIKLNIWNKFIYSIRFSINN